MKKDVSLILFFLGVFLFISCAEKQEEQQTGPVNGIVKSADSVDIAYTLTGEGDPALVFVHGWSCDRGYWKNQVDAFKDSFTVVTIDLAGHGESGDERVDYTMESYGKDVAAVVNELGLNEVILIGHSMGGKVVLAAAHELDGKVTGLVGADTYLQFNYKYDPKLWEDLIAGFENDFKTTADGFVRGMFPADADSALVDSIAADMSNANVNAAISSMKNMAKMDEDEMLEGIVIPVRAVNADLYPTNVEENRKYVDFDVKIMPGVGHFVMMEDPEEFNRLLAETVKEITEKKKS